MCKTCGCAITSGNQHLLTPPKGSVKIAGAKTTVQILSSLLDENNLQAEHNRAHLDTRKILAVNLMSAPGSGKTSLLEATAMALQGRLRMAVIEGDLETENDAARIRAKGIPAIQITTGSACHLDAHLVHKALHELDLDNLDLLFIENVGNLVCPASFDLGHHLNVTLLSVTEGDDKPAKYPVMFRASDLLLITKTDLLPFLDDFDVHQAETNFRNLAKTAPVLPNSARDDRGIDAWIGWLEKQVYNYRNLLDAHQTIKPKIQDDGVKLHINTAANSRSSLHAGG